MAHDKFRELLDQTYQWPDFYDFKFIIKSDDKKTLEEKLEGLTITETPSKNGNYTCITARKLIKSTEEVIEIYELAGTVKGVMSL
jgi:uncharacterized protein